ncbi:MAG: chloramphenicol phosphotransferase CPT [Chloroflexota bacterium]
MAARIIVLNGGSSSGKSAISRCLQATLPDPWLRLGIDDLLDALPPSLTETDAGVAIASDGTVTSGAGFHAIEAAWLDGIAAMVRSGARVIVDDVFLGGGETQARLRPHFAGIEVLWVGVRCDAAIATGREIARGDRAAGMAALQAEMVHRGVRYDLEVDSGRMAAIDCARIIAARLG